MMPTSMLPPTDGRNNSVWLEGRTYASKPGVAIQVPDFDADPLQRQGWTVVSVDPPVYNNIDTVLSGIADIFHYAATVNPAAASTAIYPAVFGDLTYPVGAAALTAGAHIIGTLGRVTNKNTVNTVPLIIGTEGKIDNSGTGTITTAISTDNNLGSNVGTIGAWYGSYSHIGSNASTITNAAFHSGNVDAGAGTINTLYGLLFNNITAGAQIATSMIGYYFANQTVYAGTRYAVFVADASALIYTVGGIRSDANTRTETFQLGSGTKTATATAGAATLNKASGKITTEALTTAAGASYTLTLTNSQIAAADTVFASVDNGTNTTVDATVTRVTPAAGSVVILVKNTSASALNGTLVISFASMKV